MLKPTKPREEAPKAEPEPAQVDFRDVLKKSQS